MLSNLQDPFKWRQAEIELGERGVKAMTFYDIVLDFIILDAFNDLSCPPSSVLAVVQNRFLSNGFKGNKIAVFPIILIQLNYVRIETALTTAVWSVLKAKKRMLKYSDGFMGYFYLISEQITPILCWVRQLKHFNNSFPLIKSHLYRDFSGQMNH